MLDRLTAGRDAVSRAAGDPAALRPALVALEAEAEEVTGAPARHRPGETYAGRGVVY